MVDESDPPSRAEDRDPELGEATLALRRAVGGDAEGQNRLFELLHAELRALAGRAMSDERVAHTLQPTALVGEVWLKLFAGDTDAFEDRRHFLSVAARAMRQVLVDHARTRNRMKRGGAWKRVELDAALDEGPGDGDEELDLVALDAALDELREVAPRPAQVVELRFFGGLEVDEAAEALGRSPRTIAREWRFARAWLLKRMSDG